MIILLMHACGRVIYELDAEAWIDDVMHLKLVATCGNPSCCCEQVDGSISNVHCTHTAGYVSHATVACHVVILLWVTTQSDTCILNEVPVPSISKTDYLYLQHCSNHK